MTIYLGVDVGSEEHALHFIDQEANHPITKMTISSDKEGFSELKEKLMGFNRKHKDQTKDQKGPTFKVGMEATGSYWKSIFQFLKELAGKLDIQVSLINPNRIHEFKKMELTRVKTDTVDARAIARYMRAFKPDPTPRMNKRMEGLRKLCRFTRSRIEDYTRLQNQLDELLTSTFPEYKNLFSELAAISSLTLLKEYPGPKRIGEATIEELSELRFGKCNHRLGKGKAKKLKQAAQDTVGNCRPEVETTLKYLAQRTLEARREVEILKGEIKGTFKKLSSNQITSVDGIGLFNGAIITTEIWDINRFPTATKLNGYVGAYPEINESGKSSQSNPEMTKKGNRQLRHAIFMSTLKALQENRVIRNHYRKQLAKGKEPMVAIGSCMRKLTHLIYGILTSGKPFDPYYEEKRQDKEEKPEPQTGSYPASESSSDFSPIYDRQIVTNCQPRGGDP